MSEKAIDPAKQDQTTLGIAEYLGYIILHEFRDVPSKLGKYISQPLYIFVLEGMLPDIYSITDCEEVIGSIVKTTRGEYQVSETPAEVLAILNNALADEDE
jgi:hypothetical protein